MHLLPERPAPQELTREEKFFLELWHGMTHEFSLDSHRVRCLNARTILRELDAELRACRLAPEELADLCAEAHAVVVDDPVVSQCFPRHLALFRPLVQKHEQIPDRKKEASSAEPSLREFRFVVADFSVALERDYFNQLLEILPDAIRSADENRTHSVVGALLSDLVDQGWPLESLFGWVDLFFQRKPEPYGTFNGNLRFLLTQLRRGRQPFRVILRLSGSTKLAALGQFEGFQFRSDSGFPAPTPALAKFGASFAQVAFAETSVQAVDFTSAAISGRERFEDCLDRMRFNFEPAPLSVDTRCVVQRTGDQRMELVVVRHLVPNPAHHLGPEAFRDFTRGINAVLERGSIEPETRERIRAAIRHYRFGRDADSYKDKFLNWWMGLEFLAHVSQGESIGRTVVRHAGDALLLRYLYRLLNDLLSTLKQQRVPWSQDLASASGCAELRDLKAAELLRLLQSPPAADILAGSFPEHPVATYRLRRLATVLQEAGKTSELIRTHHRHLVWQLGRLWRIRCCIVHGSPLQLRLPLLTANLEFYLKELIIVCLRSLGLNPHVCSLREVFQRAAIVRERTDLELSAQTAPADSIRHAVFNSVIVQENG